MDYTAVSDFQSSSVTLKTWRKKDKEQILWFWTFLPDSRLKYWYKPNWDQHFEDWFLQLSNIVCPWVRSGSFTIYKWAASWENKRFAYAKTKTQISCAVTAQLISAFVFATRIVLSLYFLNPNFKPLAISSGYKAWFVSDMVRIHIVGFLTLRLKCLCTPLSWIYCRGTMMPIIIILYSDNKSLWRLCTGLLTRQSEVRISVIPFH